MSWWIFWMGAVFASPPNVSVGQHALTFSLPAITAEESTDIQSTQVSLAAYVGVLPSSPQKAVVLYFFSRREGAEQLEALNRIQKRYAGQGVRVLAINTDTGSVGGLSAWLEEQKLDFPVLRDNHHVVLDRYGLETQPFTVIVDRDGYIFAMGAPSAADFTESLEAELAPLLTAPPAP